MNKRFINRAKSGSSVLHGPARRPGGPMRDAKIGGASKKTSGGFARSVPPKRRK